MTAFEDLKSQWGNQNQPETPSDGIKQILEKITSIRKKQQITNVVLAVTGIILIGFFFYISAYKFQTVMIGLLIMIASLFIRIGIEFSSMRTLKSMNVSKSVTQFKTALIAYYKKRTKVHFIITPLIFVAYSIGFMMLLPAFKANLSAGFYTYIIISAIVSLLVIGLLVAKEIKRELLVLKELKS